MKCIFEVSEFLKAVNVMINDLWDVRLNSRVVTYPRFVGARFLHWQGIHKLHIFYHE
jgi:hypothetical protein